MGTRSHTHFQDEDGAIIATMYRQYDGYPRGHGMDIYRYFMDDEFDRRYFPNGYSPQNHHGANGMGDAAMQFMAHLKTYHHPLIEEPTYDGESTFITEDRTVMPRYLEPRIGNYYLTTPGASGPSIDYTYTLYPSNNLPDTDDFVPSFSPAGAYNLRVQDGDNNGLVMFDGTLLEFLTWFEEDWPTYRDEDSE